MTAAVVGVIANLALWFGLRVLFGEVWTLNAGPLSVSVPNLLTLDRQAAILALLAAVCLFRLKRGVLQTLGICAVAGVVLGAVLDAV